MLTGEEIVNIGATKIGVSLPEVGTKDILPNGSWLEQKQIQSAIEARKHVIEVPRIEKSGLLSHADWQDDLNMAKVTHKMGGYWQFIGHNIGSSLYLNPEEALYLMEINCLLLKHNDVAVSLQKAYSLLLKRGTLLTQYKVFASLSRLGYKVFRHKQMDKNNDLSNIECESHVISIIENINIDTSNLPIDTTNGNRDEQTVIQNNENEEMSVDADSTEIDKSKLQGTNKSQEIIETTEKELGVISKTASVKTSSNEDNNMDNDCCVPIENHCEPTKEDLLNNTTCERITKRIDTITKTIEIDIDKLKQRLSTICSLNSHKCFKIIPNICGKDSVVMHVPQKDLIPKDMLIIKNKYLLNIEKLRNKCNVKTENTRVYSANDEANQSNVRRIRNTSTSPQNVYGPFKLHFHPSQQPGPFFRAYNLWKQHRFHNFNFDHCNFNYRPVPDLIYAPKFQQGNRPFMSSNYKHVNQSQRNIQKRSKNKMGNKNIHLEAIKSLSSRLKHLITIGNIEECNIQSLRRLIQTYNVRYNSRLQLSHDLDVLENENIIDTIQLEDDEDECPPKKSRTDDAASYTENMNKLKELALRLKELQSTETVTNRHRRAFSNVVKSFNTSYNADIYLDNSYNIIDKKLISLDSTSGTDSELNEPVRVSKKLKNPFNVLKRMSESKSNTNRNDESTSTKIEKNPEVNNDILDTAYKQSLKNWLPKPNDFGSPVIDKCMTMCLNKDELFSVYLSRHVNEHNNWIQLKISFMQELIENTKQEEIYANAFDYPAIDSIVKPEDCKNMSSILEKLRIIKSNTNLLEDTSLCINFDVYNRDVQNFRKTCPPVPHFRIICIEESTNVPSCAEVSMLYSKYSDSVPIVFAIVGISSISYLQVKPFEIPVYTSTDGNAT